MSGPGGGYPIQSWTPHLDVGWGTPCPGLGGVPPGPGMGYHQPEQETDQHCEHLLRGGRYVSTQEDFVV